jgi:anaerobic magnesium-protoporphyrin IX monomethyl ester cyclase
VGISAMTHDILSAARLAECIKKRKPDVTTVIGGVHATALPKETLHTFKSFDIVVYGEGEYTFFEVMKTLEDENPLSKIKGIAYRDKGKIIVNAARPWIEDLDSLPMPAWHLFPKTEKYHIVSARGCPYHCVFCMSPYGRKIRERSPENVITEMGEVYKKYHPRLYKFDDESFGFNKKRAHKLLNLMIKNKLNGIKKVASMRANYVDLDLLKHMKKAGFQVVDFGFETGNPKIMRIIKKGITLEQAEKAVKMCRKAGIKV